jgi:hypothetical protein
VAVDNRDMPVSLRDLLNARIPSELWHYTSIEGFKGIISSGTVWATEARSTLDPSEFIHAKSVALQLLDGMTSNDFYSEKSREAADWMVNFAFDSGTLSSERIEVFIASFSSAMDVKSQWNDFADKFRGVSIAFDLRLIRPPLDYESTISFGPCVYFHHEKEQLLKDALSHFLEEVSSLYKHVESRQWVTERLEDWKRVDRIYGIAFDRQAFDLQAANTIREDLEKARGKSTGELLGAAGHCKSEHYREECEWRLALPHLKSTELKLNKVLYRGSRGQIPYVAHDLFHDRLPITRVMAGPLCTDLDLIKDVLAANGFDVPVEKSTMPIRDPNDV